MAFGKMTDMEMTDEEKIDTFKPPSISSAPDYPWGMRISLCNREIKKLGLRGDVQRGDFIDMRCFGTVTSVSQDAGPDGEDSLRVEIQIEKMAIENEDTEETPGD